MYRPSVAFLLRDAGQGGAERSSLRLANGLAGRGLPVTVLFFHARGPMLASVRPGIKIIDLRGSFVRLLVELKRGRFDFLLPVYTAMRALMARAVSGEGFKVILSQRNMFTMERGPVQTKIRMVRYRLLAPLASACVCISQGVADEMRRLGFLAPEKIHVIYNAVVTHELLEQICEAEGAPAPHPWLEKGQPPVILGVGRLGDQKDFATLIRAFALLSKRRSDVRIVIIGEGRQRAALEGLIEKLNLTGCVLLPGYDPNPCPWMTKAAVFALTSRYEGFGNVVAEALACGCNVVSTDCPSGPAEILNGTQYGWLARVGDPEDVARALEAALNSPKPRRVLKERAALFSGERAVESWMNLLKDLHGHPDL